MCVRACVCKKDIFCCSGPDVECDIDRSATVQVIARRMFSLCFSLYSCQWASIPSFSCPLDWLCL